MTHPTVRTDGQKGLVAVSENRALLATYVVLGASVATILGAWGFEHIGGLAPCALCYTQRYFYYTAIPLCVALVALAHAADRPSLLKLGLVVCGLILLGGAGVAAYHAGIEYHWWKGPETCTGGAGLSDGSALPDLQNLNVVMCDKAAWTLFGISMAGYNVPISLALAGIAFWGARDRIDA